MIITKNNLNPVRTTAGSQSNRSGQDLPFVGTSHPAAPFDGGNAF